MKRRCVSGTVTNSSRHIVQPGTGSGPNTNDRTTQPKYTGIHPSGGYIVNHICRWKSPQLNEPKLRDLGSGRLQKERRGTQCHQVFEGRGFSRALCFGVSRSLLACPLAYCRWMHLWMGLPKRDFMLMRPGIGALIKHRAGIKLWRRVSSGDTDQFFMPFPFCSPA